MYSRLYDKKIRKGGGLLPGTTGTSISDGRQQPVKLTDCKYTSRAADTYADAPRVQESARTDFYRYSRTS